MNIDFDERSPEEKKLQLYLGQKKLLKTFLEKNAITAEQYEKSLGDLTEKMGMRGFSGEDIPGETV